MDRPIKVRCIKRWDRSSRIGTPDEVLDVYLGHGKYLDEGAYRMTYVNESRTTVYKVGTSSHGSEQAVREHEAMVALRKKCGAFGRAATPTSLWRVEGTEGEVSIIVAMKYMPHHAYGPGVDEGVGYGDIPRKHRALYERNRDYIERACEVLSLETGIYIFDMHDWNWRLDESLNPHITDAGC